MRYRIVIDKDQCVGHARCANVAPHLFKLDESGYIATYSVVDARAVREGAAPLAYLAATMAIMGCAMAATTGFDVPEGEEVAAFRGSLACPERVIKMFDAEGQQVKKTPRST